MSSKCKKFLEAFTPITLVVFHVAYGLAELGILDRSDEARYECGRGTWACILWNCIVHFMIAFISGLICAVNYNYSDVSSRTKSVLVVHFIAPIIGYIWAAVCLYNTKPRCVAIYEDEYSDLWTTIKLEVYTGIVFTIIFIVHCFICICDVIRAQRVQQAYNGNIHALLDGSRYTSV